MWVYVKYTLSERLPRTPEDKYEKTQSEKPAFQSRIEPEIFWTLTKSAYL